MVQFQKQLFYLLCLSLVLALLSAQMRLQAAAPQQLHHQHNYPLKKLFVFGNSYVDTGNTRKEPLGSWKDPYGVTFPGKPAGRFSDGRVLTDYIAKYLGLRSPLPYKFRKIMPQYLKYGMNFAYGGTGVFDTFSSNPNMTIQIDFFNKLIQEKVFTLSDLSNSVALVSVAGNDYSFYLATNGSAQGFPAFIASVVNQTTINLIRLQRLGVKKIVVGGLQPVGCLPITTAPMSFKRCNSNFNELVVLHNNLLNQSVTKLKEESKDDNTLVILNLYESFMSVIKHPSANNITEQFKPCCVGVSSKYLCGSVDENNVKKYKVCENPKSSFFWDLFHPTQAGWNAVYNKLQKGALHQL